MGKRKLDIMYVVCFYWKGDRWNEDSDLSSVYVNNLYRGVKRFANQPFRFICFTNETIPDLDSGIETRGFSIYSSKGVLPRLYMFSEVAGLFGDQVLCLDLDLVITGGLDTLMNYRGLFCTRASFQDSTKVDGDIMSFRANRTNEILFWDSFLKDIEGVEEYTQGQERRWMQFIAGDWADRWITPGEIVSYRRHARDWEEVPKGVSIVSFHGRPKPHQITKKWLKEYWSCEKRGETRKNEPITADIRALNKKVDKIYHLNKNGVKTKENKV
jgi:hypothetical protein